MPEERRGLPRLGAPACLPLSLPPGLARAQSWHPTASLCSKGRGWPWRCTRAASSPQSGGRVVWCGGSRDGVCRRLLCAGHPVLATLQLLMCPLAPHQPRLPRPAPSCRSVPRQQAAAADVTTDYLGTAVERVQQLRCGAASVCCRGGSPCSRPGGRPEVPACGAGLLGLPLCFGEQRLLACLPAHPAPPPALPPALLSPPQRGGARRPGHCVGEGVGGSAGPAARPAARERRAAGTASVAAARGCCSASPPTASEQLLPPASCVVVGGVLDRPALLLTCQALSTHTRRVTHTRAPPPPPPPARPRPCRWSA